jgi:hypothetical protein
MMRASVSYGVLASLTLVACGAPETAPPATARHVSSNELYGDGGARMHLFVFDPSEPRSLAARKNIARRTIALDPNCRWVEAPDDVLTEATARQGARYTETMLVAPVRCART